MILNIIMADNTRTWKRRTTSPLRAGERVKEQHCAQASMPAQCHYQQHAVCRGHQNILTLENVLLGWRPKDGTSPTHSLYLGRKIPLKVMQFLSRIIASQKGQI